MIATPVTAVILAAAKPYIADFSTPAALGGVKYQVRTARNYPAWALVS